MTNISREVIQFISSEPAIQKCLAKKIINMSGLAKIIKKELNLECSLDSIISAIRRFKLNDYYFKNNKNISEIFENAEISSCNNVVLVEIEGTNAITKTLLEINKIIDLDKGEILRIVKSHRTLKLIISHNKIEDIKNILSSNSYNVNNDLIEFKLRSKKIQEIKKTKGVAAMLTSELAVNDINIEENIFTSSEILIYVDSKDYLRTHDILQKITNPKTSCSGQNN